MFKPLKYFLVIFAILILTTNLILAQDEEEPKSKKDTVFIDEDFEINVDEDEGIIDFKEFKFRFRQEAHPYLKIQSGLNQFAHRSTHQAFNQTGRLDFQLGYTRTLTKSRSYLTSTNDRYINFSLNNKNLYVKNKFNPLNLNSYQFGIGGNESYGYRTSSSAILFGTGKEFNWSKISFEKTNAGVDSVVLDFYRDAVRFGESYNSNFTIQFFNFVGLNFNYRYGLIFPRHLFWKHLGSFVIEEAAESLLKEYLEKVFNLRPVAGPIVSFILKSSLQYLFYEFKKERMNWPFKTVQPLTYDVYSIGLRFTF